MSGILIVIFKPFKLGDRITITSLTGTIEDINLRQFILRDLENNRVVIPNSLVGTNALVNYNHTDIRCCKAIEIPYPQRTLSYAATGPRPGGHSDGCS